jgi:hypothetical protein
MQSRLEPPRPCGLHQAGRPARPRTRNWLPRRSAGIMDITRPGASVGSAFLHGEWVMDATVSAPLEWVEAVSDLRLPPRANERLQHLMDRNTEGLLSDSERAELETLVELSEQLALVRAQALHVLGRKPP